MTVADLNDPLVVGPMSTTSEHLPCIIFNEFNQGTCLMQFLVLIYVYDSHLSNFVSLLFPALMK